MSNADATSFWEAMYTGRPQLWSGEPNHALVAAVAGLRPGSALDLGCGEGGDSVWLASKGWRVTAVDISNLAVTRARALAARNHIPDTQITWHVADLSDWSPEARYDLVSACFLHSPLDFARTEILQRAADAGASGGHLLIVGHAAPPPWAPAHDAAHHHFLGPDDELAALQLDPADWEPVIAEVRARDAIGPNGEHAVLDDSVVLLRRV